MLNIDYFKGMGLWEINSYKGIYGWLLCIGGNCGIVGVIWFVSEVVLRSGVGMVCVYIYELLVV